MVAKAGRLTHFDQNGGFYCLCFRAMKHFVLFCFYLGGFMHLQKKKEAYVALWYFFRAVS